MTGIKEKFDSLSFLDNIPHVNIADSISFIVCEKELFMLPLLYPWLMSYLFLNFPLIYYLSANILLKITTVQYFTLHIVCFKICRLR